MTSGFSYLRLAIVHSGVWAWGELRCRCLYSRPLCRWKFPLSDPLRRFSFIALVHVHYDGSQFSISIFISKNSGIVPHPRPKTWIYFRNRSHVTSAPNGVQKKSPDGTNGWKDGPEMCTVLNPENFDYPIYEFLILKTNP